MHGPIVLAEINLVKYNINTLLQNWIKRKQKDIKKERLKSQVSVTNYPSYSGKFLHVAKFHKLAFNYESLYSPRTQ